MKTKLLVLIATLLCAPSCEAETNHNSTGGDLQRAAIQTDPWFDNFEKSIQRQILLQDLTDYMTQKLSVSTRAVCTFSVQKDGSIADLKITASSGTEALDTKILSLIKSAAPFEPTPNNLPAERGVQVEFVKDGELRITGRLDQSTRGKLFSIVDYSAPNSYHPWPRIGQYPSRL